MTRSILLITNIARSAAASPQEAAERARARIHQTRFLPSPFALDPRHSDIYAALTQTQANGDACQHAWLTGIIEDPWDAPRIAPWSLQCSHWRDGPPSLPIALGSDAWRVEVLSAPLDAKATQDEPAQWAAAYAAMQTAETLDALVYHDGRTSAVTAGLDNKALLIAALSKKEITAPPSIERLRGLLLKELCAPYADPDVFGSDQIARVCVALKHLQDRIFTHSDLALVLWNALPRQLTTALLRAFDLDPATALRPDQPEASDFGFEIPEPIRTSLNDVVESLLYAHLPNSAQFRSAAFARNETDNYRTIATSIALTPSAYLRAVEEAWESRGIDLSPPSTHRMEGLMP